MKSHVIALCILLLVSSSAFGQSDEMTIHLSTGGTVVIPLDEIQHIVFNNLLTGVGDPDLMPPALSVLQNYPNPFNPSTTIAYELQEEMEVAVRIFDLKGALIRELVRTTQPAGQHEVVWRGTDADGHPVASGIYLYAVECGDVVHSRQMILVK